MRRNGMCPFCYIKQFFTPSSPFIETYKLKRIDNGAQKAPIMGWSSWNTFRNNIDEKLIKDTAEAVKKTGLLEAGYRYINLDDNWHSSLRDENGRLQGDLTRFPRGIKPMIADLNKDGFRVGLYSSNGTLTCEDLPASLHREKLDARTIAEWGVEYFKYDFCHHEYMSKYAPLVYGIEIAKPASSDATFYDCKKSRVFGTAKFMRDKKVPVGCHVSGLDKNGGYMEYDNIYMEEEGYYVLTVCIRKKGNKYAKVLAAHVNEEDFYVYDIPCQNKPNFTGRFQQVVHLKKGQNTIRLFNPVARRSDSSFLQYYNMGKELAAAAKERQGEFRPIVYSICEWGFNKPYKWGSLAGNMWRTTPDIRPWFWWIKIIYEHTVKLYKYALPGAWNDPDMLEVGNGKLTENQNIAHFSLWCMMNAPLVLGNDIRKIPDSVLKIVTDKTMISINQDETYKPCKRIIKGSVDLLAKPLTNGRVAVCLFNKTKSKKSISASLEKIFDDNYINLKRKESYSVNEVWSGEKYDFTDKIAVTVPAESVKVFILE